MPMKTHYEQISVEQVKRKVIALQRSSLAQDADVIMFPPAPRSEEPPLIMHSSNDAPETTDGKEDQ